MSWCSGVCLSSKPWGFCGLCPGFSSALLDLYSEESSPRSWAGGGAGSGGGAAFCAGAVGLGLDEDPNGATGAFTKGPCFSLGSDMVAIW